MTCTDLPASASSKEGSSIAAFGGTTAPRLASLNASRGSFGLAHTVVTIFMASLKDSSLGWWLAALLDRYVLAVEQLAREMLYSSSSRRRCLRSPPKLIPIVAARELRPCPLIGEPSGEA
jgi:hypothetical protein